MVGYRRAGARLVCAVLLATVVGALCASAKTVDAQTWREERTKRSRRSRISALSTSDRTRSVSLGKALEAAAGYSETVVYQLWQNDEWVDYLCHTVWYASEGYPVSEREQMWDATGGAWVNSDSAAELYGPGGLGEHEGYECYSWDAATGEWQLAEAEWDEVDTTDGDGNRMVLSDVRAHRALNDDLVLQWETAETYDSQDRTIRIVATEGQSGWIWPMDEPDEEVTSSIQIDYTYDGSGGWREDWVCVADTNGDATMDTLRGAWRFVQTSDTDVLEQYDLYGFDSPTDSAVVFKLCRGFDNGEQVFDSLLVYDETASEWITYGVIAEVVLPNGFEESREWVKEYDDGLGVIVGEYEKAVEGIDATTGAFLYAESLFVWTPDPGEWTFVAYECETEFLHDSGYGESGELDTATGEWDKWKLEWGVILPDWRWDELELGWFNDGAEWVPYNNFTRTDSGGVVIGIDDWWNEGSGEYVNSGRSVLYAFDADSNVLSRIDYQWDDGYWQRRDSLLFTYDTEGRVATRTSYSWNSDTDTWSSGTRMVFSYEGTAVSRFASPAQTAASAGPALGQNLVIGNELHVPLTLDQASLVTAELLDLRGRTAEVLLRNRYLAAGTHALDMTLPSAGAFVLRVRSSDGAVSRRILSAR